MKLRLSLALACLLSAALVAGACTPPPDPPPDAGEPQPDGGPNIDCPVAPVTSCPDPAPTYDEVKPIFESRCVVCHAGAWGGPWPLNDYQHVADWKDDIRGDLTNCIMPPADAGFALPSAERIKILQWIRCGIPR